MLLEKSGPTSEIESVSSIPYESHKGHDEETPLAVPLLPLRLRPPERGRSMMGGALYQRRGEVGEV